MFRYIFLMVLTCHLSNGNVLKVKNEEEQSGAASLEHKTPLIEAQAHEVRRFEVKNRDDDDDFNDNQKLRHDSRKTLSMINQAVDVLKNTISKPEFRSSKTLSFIDKVLDSAKSYVNGPDFRSSKTMRYIQKVVDIVKDAANGPEYRSGGKPNMRTEMVHLQKGQPSFVFEMKPEFFVGFVKNVLSSRLMENLMDDLSHGQRRPKKYASRYQQ